MICFFFSSRRRHTRSLCDWSSDVCSSDLVAMIPNETRARVQLTPAGTTPMTMELLAHLEMGGVELSPTFQLAQLTLKWRTSVVHVTLNPKAPEQSGASFDVAEVELDRWGKIAELLLNPIK